MSKQGRLESDTDFNTVTILRKHAPPVKTLRSSSDLNAAKRNGVDVETNKKYGAAGNKQHKGDMNTARLDDETDQLHHERVSLSLGMAIQCGRQKKEFTQKDLAQRINEKVEVIREYETGKAVPNQQILAKIERILSIKLRGKDIGQPLSAVKPAAKK